MNKKVIIGQIVFAKQVNIIQKQLDKKFPSYNLICACKKRSHLNTDSGNT
jgi:hypothetical protein